MSGAAIDSLKVDWYDKSQKLYAETRGKLEKKDFERDKYWTLQTAQRLAQGDKRRIALQYVRRVNDDNASYPGKERAQRLKAGHAGRRG